MTTAARQRINRYAELAPEGARLAFTEESSEFLDVAQVVIVGDIDKILISVSSRPGSMRTRCSAVSWFNSSSKTTKIPARAIAWRVRSLFVKRG